MKKIFAFEALLIFLSIILHASGADDMDVSHFHESTVPAYQLIQQALEATYKYSDCPDQETRIGYLSELIDFYKSNTTSIMFVQDKTNFNNVEAEFFLKYQRGLFAITQFKQQTDKEIHLVNQLKEQTQQVSKLEYHNLDEDILLQYAIESSLQTSQEENLMNILSQTKLSENNSMDI